MALEAKLWYIRAVEGGDCVEIPKGGFWSRKAVTMPDKYQSGSRL